MNFLLSDFYFGFELECFFPKNVEKELILFFENNNWSRKFDMSIHPDVDGATYITSEFISPPTKMTIQNILKFKNILNKSFSLGVRTNKSCGAHIHLSVGEIPLKFQIFYRTFFLYMVCHTRQIVRISKIKINEDEWFSKKYASLPDTLKSYGEICERVQQEKYDFINIHHKYSILNLHHKYPTLEWRGPREIFNNNTNNTNKLISYLVSFIKTLSRFEIDRRLLNKYLIYLKDSQKKLYNMLEMTSWPSNTKKYLLLLSRFGVKEKNSLPLIYCWCINSFEILNNLFLNKIDLVEITLSRNSSGLITLTSTPNLRLSIRMKSLPSYGQLKDIKKIVIDSSTLIERTSFIDVNHLQVYTLLTDFYFTDCIFENIVFLELRVTNTIFFVDCVFKNSKIEFINKSVDIKPKIFLKNCIFEDILISPAEIEIITI